MSEPDFGDYLNNQLATEEPEVVEPAAEPEAEAVAEEAAPATETARDEQGRFAKADEIDPKVEQRLKEKDKVIGSMANEIGELRKLVEAKPQPEPDYGDVENLALDPNLAARIAASALERGDDLTYERTINAWRENDEWGALRFDARAQAWKAQQQALGYIGPQIANAQKASDQKLQSDAAAAIAARYEDFAHVMGGIKPEEAEALQDSPALRKALADAELAGTQEAYEAVFDTLYLVNARRQAGQSQAARVQADAAHEAETKQAKQQAAVANSTTAPVAEGTGDPELDSFYEYMAAPSPTSWTAGR